MSQVIPLERAQMFARALDAEDYQAATGCLSNACVYQIREKELVGASAIIASYRSAGEWARESFDEIKYESSVLDASDGQYSIRFVDLTRHRGLDHRHECEQVLSIGPDGLIDRIVHVDLRGERDRLDAFLEKVGVARRV